MTERRMQLDDWLDDLCARFILNLPLADLGSIERICFQVEEAQWFYEDFIRPLDPALPSMNLRNFSELIFAHCPILSDFSRGKHMAAFEQFMMYKKRVPVRGAIMLNEAMDAAVLVKGWKKGANWSFPRGKINKDEDDLDCAVREVYEETGFHLSDAGHVPHDRSVKKIEVNMRDQQVHLFVFRDVPMDTPFAPRTRKEISKIDWWLLSDLPAFRKKGQEQKEPTQNASKFYMVAPFLVPLRKWVVEEKKKDAKRVSNNQYLSAGISNDEMFTEDDRGAESTGPTQFGGETNDSTPDRHRLEDASAALNRLLNVQQPPPQELQAGPTSTAHPGNNVGEALLAMLHSQPPTSNNSMPQNAPPHTPLDHFIGHPQMPPTPQHFPSRSYMPNTHQPPPPPLSAYEPTAFTYQLPQQQALHQPQYAPQMYQGNRQTQQPAPRRNQNPHIHQSQHLIHPQPLPPHVQKAVFTGDPIHAPMAPPPQQVQQPLQKTPSSLAVASPQFSGSRSTMIPPQPMPIPNPQALTSHAIALLNAFKTQDQVADKGADKAPATADLQLRNFEQVSTSIHKHLPQELPADASQQVRQPFQPQAGQHQNGSIPAPPPILAARQPISATQRSALLGLFKSPLTPAAAPAKQFLSTTPSSGGSPSAVELSAVEPLSTHAASTSALLNDKRSPDYAANVGTKRHQASGEQLPFRPVGILVRPADASENVGFERDTSGHKVRSKAKQPATHSKVFEPVTKHTEKPFPPQILKRPQPGISRSPEGIAPAQTSFPSPAMSSSKPVDHTQTLLSMFLKGQKAAGSFTRSPTSEPLISLPPVDPALGISARSRVGSLVSSEGGIHRGSQTPISPADKGFLLNYLDAVANGAQR
ncbi:related to decapping enzyme [Rhynchosporium agropyri]|uniref:Related to decapping enzyme n=1 Tax=Rhynchosporium agropyri TaxID=914238 RepID=A0A1E1KC29_9HELO|nr:related to decapping enzyme [Rhynchosporium agropyri]